MKKNELLPFAATWLALENIILNITLSEISQMRKTCYIISLTCGILKYNTNESIYKPEADYRLRKQTYGQLPKRKGAERRINKQCRINRYTFLYIR